MSCPSVPICSLLLDQNATLRLERTPFNPLVNFNFELYGINDKTSVENTFYENTLHLQRIFLWVYVPQPH